MDYTVLVTEDEFRLRKLICDYFGREGFGTLTAGDGRECLNIFENSRVDLIILDIMMPHMDGWTTCRKLRSISSVPVIILTARPEENDKLLGYELGADDYVTKPFSPRVLVARAKALLRRVDGKADGEVLRSGGIVLDDTSHEVTVKGMPLALSPNEYDLLFYLMKNRNIALSRSRILDNVWGYDYYGDLRTVDTHIKRLREKLGNEACLIKTIRGHGYKMEVRINA